MAHSTNRPHRARMPYLIHPLTGEIVTLDYLRAVAKRGSALARKFPEADVDADHASGEEPGMGWAPKGHAARDDSIAPSRFWKAPSGAVYRVCLEPAAGHLRMHGETRATLTFVLMRDRDRTVRVPESTQLEQLTDAQLVELLASAK